jgi:hypothetical protein
MEWCLIQKLYLKSGFQLSAIHLTRVLRKVNTLFTMDNFDTHPIYVDRLRCLLIPLLYDAVV